MSELLAAINAMNRFETEQFVGFWVGEQMVGHIHRRFVSDILNSGYFEAFNDGLRLDRALDTPAARTQAVADVVSRLSGKVEMFLRNEYCDVKPYFGEPTLLQIQRGAHEFFGVKGYGVHVNGWTVQGGEVLLWAAKRSPKKSRYPGMMDDMVAGGLTGGGYSPKQILLKEAYEEAHLPQAIAATAQPCGIITYRRNVGYLTEWATIFVYDLLLPEDISPCPNDGEVESFQRLTLPQALEWVAQGNVYKPNCNLVVLDFLIRHGAIPAEHPEYEALCEGLRGNVKNLSRYLSMT